MAPHLLFLEVLLEILDKLITNLRCSPEGFIYYTCDFQQPNSQQILQVYATSLRLALPPKRSPSDKTSKLSSLQIKVTMITIVHLLLIIIHICGHKCLEF